MSVPFVYAQAAGDLIVVAAGWNDSTAVISSISDTSGNTYTLAAGPNVIAGLESQSIYYAGNIVAAPAGSNTVTVTFSTAAVNPDIRILEYAGADPINPLDVASSSYGNSALSSTSLITTNATDLLFAANTVQTLTLPPTDGFAPRIITQPDGDIAEDQMAGTAGIYNVSNQVTPPAPWIMQMVAFRAASLAPTAPGNLTATAAGISQIVLNWTASASSLGLAKYVVQRCPGAGCSNFAPIAVPTATTFSDSGLLAGATYTYRVNAVDVNGNISGFSNLASATTLAPPTAPANLTAVAAGPTQINLNWSASTSSVGLLNYVLQRCQGAGCTNFLQIAAPAGTSFSDTTLLANTTYSYQVQAVDVLGDLSELSNVAAVATLLAPPSIYTITPASGTVGTVVTITGRRFQTDQDDSTVTFNGVTASPTAWNYRSITTAVPAGATSGNVLVTVGGLASNPFTFTVLPSPAAAPAFIPAGGTYNSPQTISITSTSSGVSIRYTTDGSTPSETAGTLYTAPFTVNATATVAAIAYGGGFADSPVSSATYTIASQAGWYSAGGTWNYRKAITIPSTQISGASNLTNFPILFSQTDPDLRSAGNGGSVGQLSGNDILFTASDGVSKLNHELEAYNPATGQTIAWVQAPSVSPSADTTIYIYFGNASASSQQNPGGVWDTNYQGVWHFPNGAILTTNDSSSYGNNGMNTTAVATNGEIGGAAAFDGTSSVIDIDGIANGLQTGSVTFSAWVRPTSNYSASSPYETIMRLGDNPSDNDVVLSFNQLNIPLLNNPNQGADQPDGALHLLVCSSAGCGEAVSSQTSWLANTWYYLVGTYSAGNGLQVYVNGTQAGASSVVTSRGSRYAANAAVGAWSDGNSYLDYFSGSVDEARVSNIARSAGWIATEYNNQNSPQTFVTVGTLQTLAQQVATPVFSPAPGLYLSAVAVTISTTTSGASIRYTTDGSAPSETAGTLYTGPITAGSSTTINAIAYETGMTDSPVSSATYTVAPPVAAPVFSPPAGTYTSSQTVTIGTITPGASIRYTTNGTTPSETAGTLYTGPISVVNTTTINAVAYETGMTDSPIRTATYTISPPVAAPVFTPAGGTYTSTQTVAISTTTSGASIRYTTNGTAPSETAGTLYTGPITVGSNTTINAIAYETGMTDSPIGTATYTISLPVAAPLFSPAAGTYTSAQTVAISTTTSGASIRYTTNGTAPSETAGALYTGPITVGSTATINAIAYETGMTDSPIGTATYTISLPVAAPAFTPAAGTYTSAQTVAISTTTSGATIRYTTDGSAPSETAGVVYSAPITVNSTTTINAIAYETGLTDSVVVAATYTITSAPNISTVSPPAAAMGTFVTITGVNFGAVQGTSTVTFNGTVASPSSWTNTSIITPVPPGALTGNIVVTVSGLASSGVNFTVPPLQVLTSNPRYFTDGTGRAIYLTGSHTWWNLIDVGNTLPEPVFDYTGYLNFLAANHHNFFRLWTESLPKRNWSAIDSPPGPYYTAQHPWLRTGPGLASDGLPQFDLTQFDQSYFDRVRSRVLQAYSQGMFVSVMLFDGYHLQFDRRPDDGYPLTGGNNVNGLDDGGGTNSQNLSAIPAAELAIERAYVQKIIDTVNDLPNVLYEIADEAGSYSTSWQEYFITFVHNYEAGKPLQHPVGFTFQWSGGSDSTLYASSADWVSPESTYPNNDGLDHVVENDTDHSYYWTTMQEYGAPGQMNFVWQNLTLGNASLFMDPYLVAYPTRNHATGCTGLACTVVDPQWNPIRQNMGYAAGYAQRMNLAAMTPHAGLASTGFALANTAAGASEFLIYAPSGGSFTVNLSNTFDSLNVEWLNPSTGAKTPGGSVLGGSASTSFTAPFSGGAVLYLYDSALAR